MQTSSLKALAALGILMAAAAAAAQTSTYHLHNEASTINTSFKKLLTARPDAAATTATVALKSKIAGEYLIKEFETQTSVPNMHGVIPSGSTVSDASNRLITVIDPASRHLSFTHVSPSSNLVSSVTSDAGITLSYAYDGQGRLTQVTKTDNTTISFQYDANSNLTTVLDTSGKVLESHTYDVLHRGLTSSRANGVDAVTVTYPQ